MLRSVRPATFLPVLALAGAAGVAMAMTLVLSRPEALLDSSFGRALAAVPAVAVAEAPAGQAMAEAKLWLSKAEPETSLDVLKSMRVGDQITIGGVDGPARRLEIAEVRALQADGVSAASEEQARLVMVTARVVGDAVGGVVRFIVEAAPQDARPPANAKGPHAL